MSLEENDRTMMFTGSPRYARDDGIIFVFDIRVLFGYHKS